MKFYPQSSNSFFDSFDSLFQNPFFKHQEGFMKTDIREKDGNYLFDIELPGCNKEDIDIDLENGYLKISATRNSSQEEKDSKGNIIHCERYDGAYSRMFYVGDNISADDIKASYNNGELKITLPNKNLQIENKKKIYIE